MVELRWIQSSPDANGHEKWDCLQWREIDYLPEESFSTEMVIREWTDVPFVEKELM